MSEDNQYVSVHPPLPEENDSGVESPQNQSLPDEPPQNQSLPDEPPQNQSLTDEPPQNQSLTDEPTQNQSLTDEPTQNQSLTNESTQNQPLKRQDNYGTGLNFKLMTDTKLKEIANSNDYHNAALAREELRERENARADKPPPDPPKNTTPPLSDKPRSTGSKYHNSDIFLERHKTIILSVLFVISFLFVLSVAWQNNGLKFESIFAYTFFSSIITYILYRVLLVLYWGLIIAAIIAITTILFFAVQVTSGLFFDTTTASKVQSATTKGNSATHK